MTKIIVILIILILILIFCKETFEDTEKEYVYSIYNSKNNTYYDLITLTQLDNKMQEKVIDYITTNNLNIQKTLSLKFVKYQISHDKKYSVPNNLLFAYPRVNNLPNLIINQKHIIKFIIDHINSIKQNTDFKLGLYENTVLLYTKDDPYNTKNNIVINEDAVINNVGLDKMGNLNLYQIISADNSDFTLIKSEYKPTKN